MKLCALPNSPTVAYPSLGGKDDHYGMPLREGWPLGDTTVGSLVFCVYVGCTYVFLPEFVGNFF